MNFNDECIGSAGVWSAFSSLGARGNKSNGYSQDTPSFQQGQLHWEGVYHIVGFVCM